jgi:membrane protein DedA with SNARE-associated domain
MVIMGWHDFVIQVIIFTSSLGYLGIFILMAIESSILPIPSELLLIPAGVLVAGGSMNFSALLATCVLGSVFGALIMYYLAYFLGRRGFNKLVTKVPFISQSHLERSEKYFEKNGDITIFIGRFIPVVRHLISIPAGFAKMKLWKFCLYTGIGAGVWSTILIDIGYFFNSTDPIIEKNFELLATIFVLLAVVIVTIYFALKDMKNASRKEKI